MPNWFRGGVNFLKYNAKNENEITTEAAGTLNYSLPFHTDYYYPTAHKSGTKPEITVTMYFNDDYEGGDIEFRVFEKQYTHMRIEGNTMIDMDTKQVIEGFNYKPQAGDIIIFPSKLPFYHGVKKVTKGQKLLARTF
jgi:predicted 2-oxoglutarate/Fe(II)-dependent dioxygenase YbiX